MADEEILEEKVEESPVSEEGDTSCPKCSSRRVSVSDIVDTAPSIHYVRYDATYHCHKCNNSWVGDYGYRGLA
jgi:transposase-like protein